MSSQHTPGPWEIHDGGKFGSYGDNGPSVCAVTGPGLCQPLFDLCGPASEMQCRANAALIAAAPELLEALRGLSDAVIEYGRTVAEWDRVLDADKAARAAIAKAEGK